ncbi:hypothetical protein OIHEL45_01180 [Sulfitobacter indolifex HEL-45]|uniref:Uncharacterized protein n=1 Tax=Sulfitobacter indolifex HEL-45 TaxID=391624 RepID=A0ABP2DAR8_9RHOB|nr:hypothetical protein OIHEL45_01180 [Sulfitobacter indolifex HEL-45]
MNALLFFVCGGRITDGARGLGAAQPVISPKMI